jgi:4-carboxymuconolactone decarboxylase
LTRLTRRSLTAASLFLAGGLSTMADAQSPQPSRAQQLMGDIAPKLADLTDTVLFGDVWERPGLSKRDRSLITCAALIALNRTEQQVGHFTRAINNGVKKEELIELITHLAFYSGWPTAMSAANVAKQVLEEGDKK